MGIFDNPNTVTYFTWLLLLKEHFLMVTVYQKLSQMWVDYCIRVLKYAHMNEDYVTTINRNSLCVTDLILWPTYVYCLLLSLFTYIFDLVILTEYNKIKYEHQSCHGYKLKLKTRFLGNFLISRNEIQQISVISIENMWIMACTTKAAIHRGVHIKRGGGQSNSDSCRQGGRGLVKWECPHFEKFCKFIFEIAHAGSYLCNWIQVTCYLTTP